MKKDILPASKLLNSFAILYIVLGLWCSILPSKTSYSVGFLLIGSSGLSEFLVVYGGLEIALGIFFYLAAKDSRLNYAGTFFAFLSSATLCSFRIFSIILCNIKMSANIEFVTYVTFAFEITMTIASFIAFKNHPLRTISRDA